MNNDTDVLTVEKKPSVKGVKADVRKGHMLKKHALYLWSKQVDSSVLMEKLEAISCQWQSTKFTIYGSRLLPSDTMLVYEKGSNSFPISSRHSPQFSKLLLAILSLKRIAKLNYAKFNLILEEKYKNKVKTLNFDDDIFNEISFISSSTHSDEKFEDEYDDEENEPVDENFLENTKAMPDGLKEDEQNLKLFCKRLKINKKNLFGLMELKWHPLFGIGNLFVISIFRFKIKVAILAFTEMWQLGPRYEL